MNTLITLGITCLAIYLGTSWLLPKLIGWLLFRYFKIKVRIGRIGLPLSFKNVNFYKNGMSVQIDEFCFRSSFFNSEVTKLVSINVRDIRINIDINSKCCVLSPFSSNSHHKDAESLIKDSTGKTVLDFRNTKIPPYIVTFIQFIAAHMNNISVVLMNNDFEPGWFLHATAKELHLDGSIVHNARTLLINAAITDVQGKILRHCPSRRQSLENLNKIRPCLAELSFDVSLDAVLIAQGPLSVEQIQLSMNNARATVHGGLYDFLREAKKRTNNSSEKYTDESDNEAIKTSKLPKTTNIGKFITKSNYSSSNEKYQRFAPIIPKNFTIVMKAATFSAVKENTQNDFSAKMQLFTITGKFNSKSLNEHVNLPMLCTKFQLQHLDIDTKYEKLLFIEQFNIDSKLDNDILNIYLKLKTFQLIYNHSEIYNWVNNNFLSRKKSSSTPLLLSKQIYEDFKNTKQTNPTQFHSCNQHHCHTYNRNGIFEWILKRIIIKGCAELWNVSTLVKLDEQNAAISVSHIRLLLEQFDDKRSSVYNNHLLNLILHNRHWSTELMIESLWWSLGNSIGNDTNNLKKNHSRGSPFFLGVSLIKLSSYGNVTKLELSIHTLRTEYSTCLAEFIVKTFRCIKQYGFNGLNKIHRKHDDDGVGILKMTNSKPENNNGGNTGNNTGGIINSCGGLLVTAKIKDITAYFINHYDACILVSLKEITLTRTQQISVFKLEDFQIAIMRSMNTVSSFCLTDFTDIFSNVKVIRIEYERCSRITNNPKISIYVLDDSAIMWNSNLHMHIVTLLRDMKEFRIELNPISETIENVERATATEAEGASNATTCDKKFSKIEKKSIISKLFENENLSIDMSIERNAIFEIKISERHIMQYFFENTCMSYKKDKFLVSIENIFIKIDDQHIFTFKDLYFQSVPKLDVLSLERQRHFDGFTLLTNRVWITTIGTFKAIFPYDHDFSDAIQNEFVSLFKWLKVVHNIKKRDFSKESQLPSDMFIQVKEFLFELSDDPFEVKLRDNYVLLVDEHYESEKREELFNERILKKYSGSINSVPTITIESLYASLIKKNSEIYIQRSKKLYESGPTRTRLFAWIMTDLEIMVMSDPTIYGKENVTRIMREIDPDSPWPEEGLEFVTLWCRGVNVSCTEWKFMLRDFPQPMFYVKQMRLFGMLCGAEQVAPKRARRDVQIEVGEPFGTDMIQRGMTALKFYHDFDCALEHCSYAFGPCWEPVMAQCNLSLEKIFAPSRDPSPVLPFWDKMRLLFHGRLTMIIEKQFTVLLHASLDPYNTTEEMELTWSNECGIVWTNAKIMFKGDLNIYVRTASRYDDCRILKFPNLKLTFKLNWICLANPNDHHAVIPCAPDKLPEYSSNQVHDSFRAFRSQNLNIWVSFETKPCPDNDPEKTPELVLYGSTLRWFESLKLILSGVTRPTRRGLVFNNVRPRKKQLSRHYKRANLQMSLHKFQVLYWMSHAGHKGFQLNGGRVSFSSEYNLTLHPIDDGLIHRPRAEWSTVYMNCDLNDAEIWLRSILSEKLDISSENIANTDIVKTVRFYFLSVAKVSYGRETMLKTSNNEEQNKQKSSTPTHKLVVYDLKGAWTKNNRDVAFALFDSFMKSQKLKHNLGTEALKGFRKESSGSTSTGSSLLKSRRQESSNSLTSIATTTEIIRPTATSTTISKPQQATHATAMLQQLIAEADHKFNVYSDDDQSTQPRELQLQGVQACGSNDVIHENWSITLVNSQVLLKGCETAGYVILSAAKAEILQRVHRPVWRDRSLVSKTTWKGSLECMQYYATVSAGENDSLLEREIMWLTVDNIQEKDKDATIINDLPDIPHLVGSGRSVGGVVSETVGASGMVGIGEVQPIQLQRIVSRCKCEFFYVSYGDTIDPGTITEVPPPPPEETLSPWERQDDPVDAFTLMHHDLDVCTNSLQYAMILDIVNNLMLYVEPQRKQALEKLARMRFELQLYSSEDQKRPIQHLQTEIRSLVSKIRSLEKDIHMIGKSRAEEGDSEELKKRFEEKQREIRNEKEKLNVSTEKLDMMLICYKETQLSAMNKLSTVRTDKPVTIVRANEICFKHAQWRLTETDGQIGIADLVLSDFLYTKKSKSDDSIEHLLELGHIRMNNLIPREIYKEVLCPTEIQKDMPVDSHKRVLRVFCREKPPVGGISVKEHFEINVAPITIAITKKFYSTMLRFCFPDREQLEADNAVDDVDDNAGTMSSSSSKSLSKKSTKLKKSSRDSAFYVKINTTKDEQKKGEKDDVDKMKERAEKNKLFIYIKIPEVPVRVSYKGNKEKNFEDITDFSLVIPTLEYHNVTWTWLDLLLAMKSDSRRVILSQAIKQKLQIHRRQPLSITGERSSPQEEDKAKILFGDRHAAENRSQRKGVFKFTTSKP